MSPNQADASPLVTVVMPVRNEAAFIGPSLASVLAQDYPMSQVEILVLDGMSDDGTRQVVEGFLRTWGQGSGARGWGPERNAESVSLNLGDLGVLGGSIPVSGPDGTAPRSLGVPVPTLPFPLSPSPLGGSIPASEGQASGLSASPPPVPLPVPVPLPLPVPNLNLNLNLNLVLLDNPGRIVPTAMNIAIRAARGRWLIRLDAHSVYPPDYIRLCVETAQRTGADNVGGVCLTFPRDGSAGAGLVEALATSRFGVGGARFRVGGPEGPADTVPFGCFRREVFDEVGLFDERLVRNQDYEFNCRLTRAGKRIWLNPAIQVRYFNQATLGGLFRQAFGTGKWNPWTWFVAPYSFAPRHVIPGLFVAGLFLVLSLWFVVGWGWIAVAAILVPYFVLALVASFQQARRFGFGLAIPLPFLFFTYHASYGLGTLWGALRLLVGAAPVQRKGRGKGVGRGGGDEGRSQKSDVRS